LRMLMRSVVGLLGHKRCWLRNGCGCGFGFGFGFGLVRFVSVGNVVRFVNGVREHVGGSDRYGERERASWKHNELARRACGRTRVRRGSRRGSRRGGCSRGRLRRNRGMVQTGDRGLEAGQRYQLTAAVELDDVVDRVDAVDDSPGASP